jgi:hypothetical protein
VYCGTIVTEEGKEKKVNIDFEPFKPINTSLYLCDNKFHTEALSGLLQDEHKFGFIVMDGELNSSYMCLCFHVTLISLFNSTSRDNIGWFLTFPRD